MWYVLAAANALSGDSELIAGTQLRVPEVGVSKNDASTFKPYNPNEIVGSTSPGLPYIPPPGSLSCKQTIILLATTIVRVAAGFFGGVAGVMVADALMQKVEINSGIRSEYSLGQTVAAGVFALFAPGISNATNWAKAGYAALAAATAYTSSYLVDKARGADVHFNWSNLAASVVTSMISTKLGAVGNTGVAAGGTVSSALNSTAFSWSKVASDAVKNLAISAVNKGVTQVITGDKAQWDAGAMFADSFGNALGSAIAVKLNQKFLSYDERRSLKSMSPQAQAEFQAHKAQGMSPRHAYDYVTNAGGLRAMGDAWFGLGSADEQIELQEPAKASNDSDITPSRAQQLDWIKRGIKIFQQMRADGILDKYGLYGDIDKIKKSHSDAFYVRFDPDRTKFKNATGNIPLDTALAQTDITKFSGIYVFEVRSLQDAVDTILHEVAHLDSRMQRLWKVTDTQIKSGYEPYWDYYTTDSNAEYDTQDYQLMAHDKIYKTTQAILEKYYEKYTSEKYIK